ncbi:MAG: putative aliphatic sulfonates transport permease protein SsuC [Chloroflexi bacterium ADurb.Bin325]|nr:MAG: putative aliphatic sulfonates transport permease protein SsuC [Chloroflexi bacterium ADurb.Bin325]
MRFSTATARALRNNLVGLGLLLAAWLAAARFLPDYILPSPARVWRAAPDILDAGFAAHLALTVQRVFIGFGLAFGVGSAAGILAFTLRLTEALSSALVALQAMPGAILGVILLLIFGIGDWVPIALVALLTLPTIAINTANALAKRDLRLEQYMRSAGARRRHLVRYLYVPALIPTFQSNLSLGFGLGIKVVVLGEFIGSQAGLGYLLNVAMIQFAMSAVLAYLWVILIIMALFEAAQSLLFDLFLGRYFYPA